MIDRENVIGNLEMNIRWITDHSAHQFPGWGNAVAAMTDALALLKEHEPVRPIIEQEMDDICSCIENVAYCGRCGARIGRSINNYCSECGQAVKWE